MSDIVKRTQSSHDGISEMEAVQLCNGLIDVMKRLETLLAEETERVQARAYDALAALHTDKAKLSKAYMELMSALRPELGAVSAAAPDLIEHVRIRHDALQTVIRENLTAIGAAKAVSESLLLTIADEAQKKRAPFTAYTSTGGTRQSARNNPAIAVNEQF